MSSSQAVRASGGKPLAIEVRRDDGSRRASDADSRGAPEKSIFGEEIGKAYLIGIERFVEIAPVSLDASAIGLGVYETYFWVEDDAAERREDLPGLGVGARPRWSDPDRRRPRGSRPSAVSTT